MNWLQKIAQAVEVVARRHIDEEFPREFFRQPNDEFVYHITSANNLDSILSNGLTSGNPPMFEAGSYPIHSQNRIFLTERSGLSFWDDRIEQQLRHQFDNPPDIVIVRISKAAVEGRLQADELGTNDATEPSFFIDDTGHGL